MRRTRGRDNHRERALRSALHRLGFRFRLHVRPLASSRCTVDLVLPRYRVAIFLDGCFWHGCPEHGTWPRRNATFWRKKIEENIARDAEFTSTLEAAGWLVVRIWEHTPLADAVTQTLEAGRRR
jgi:DNA mismatch endonuclease, patch repair protein